MAKTRLGLIAHCKSAISWKYVYGAKGKVMTRAQIQALRNAYGSLVWKSDLSKAGCVCCDCSGLISSYTGVLRSSANYKATAKEIVSIAQLKGNWSAYVGYGLWLNGHIGVVSDTVGYYYAMDGSGRNWVHYPLSRNNWVCAIRLCDIDYGTRTTATIMQPQNCKDDINVMYRVYANKWYEEVINCNDTSAQGYAGVNNKAVDCIAARASKGVITYRVHVNGRWLPFVRGCDINNPNGYAGIFGKAIDGLQMEINGVPGYNILYRVSIVERERYLSWVTNWNNTENGYAGIFGKQIDKIQIKVVKK